jgi:hypothetical protein
MSTRWLVERPADDFDIVGAETMTVLPCGALKFYNGSAFEPEDVLVIAPGQWLTVCEEQE